MSLTVRLNETPSVSLPDPGEIEQQLIEYYDAEGDERLTRPVDPQRLNARVQFLDSIAPLGPCSVLEIGSGPGRDAAAFLDAGHSYTAIELSTQHARRCRDVGASVVQATVRRLPFRDGSFSALWSMSTMMHVPNSAIDTALKEVARVLQPSGLAAIGVWGGPDVEEYSAMDRNAGRPPRLFSRRSASRWSSMLAAIGNVEEFRTWGDDIDYLYQLALVRKAS